MGPQVISVVVRIRSSGIGLWNNTPANPNTNHVLTVSFGPSVALYNIAPVAVAEADSRV